MQNGFVFNIISCLSITPAALLGAIFSRKMATKYLPFAIITWLGLLNECYSLYSIFNQRSNAVNSNNYVLAEFLLFLWLFYGWGVSIAIRWLQLVAFAGIAVWVTDNIFFNTLDRFNSGFRVFYAFTIVGISLKKAIEIVAQESRFLVRHTQFWLCMAFIVFYSFKAYLEAFYLFETGASASFFGHLFFVMQLVNLFTNIIFATVYLWMPKKQEFLLH